MRRIKGERISAHPALRATLSRSRGRGPSRSLCEWRSSSSLYGILIGGVYALIGIGLTIIFGVMRIINFAHGELLMLGMYATYYLFSLFHVDPFLSIFITMPLMFFFGAFLQKIVINRTLAAPPQNQILLTIGLGLIMSNSVMLAFTSDYKILSTKYSSSSVRIMGISISLPLMI
ncbi:MAG: hypothetical protein DMF57_00405, partial [Acidobacteria bacterium]